MPYSGSVRGHHLAVSIDRKDQRDIHADTCGEGARDGRQSGSGGRNLDHGIGAINQRPELTGLLDSRLGVVRQSWIYFDGHPPVSTTGTCVDGGQDVARGTDIVGRERADRSVNVCARCPEFAHLRGVVVAAAGNRFLENCRISRDTRYCALLHQALQVAVQAATTEVVQPQADPRRCELCENNWCHELCAATTRRVASAMASAVTPNSENNTEASPLAPK